MNRIIFLATVSFFLLTACNSNAPTTPPTDPPTRPAAAIPPAAPAPGFKHQEASVAGRNMHYVIGGTGEPLVLLHGFGQNWYMWNRLLPELAKHFTVIAPDLPGLGESDKPDTVYDKKTMAVHIHELVRQLGFQNINLAGHDIGLMVAYAYAAQFGGEVKKLALMDAVLPGVEPVWGQVKAFAWWFGFFSWPASAQIVAGKEKECLTNFWPVVGHVQHPFNDEETNEFVRVYSTPGSMPRSFHWFGGFDQDAIDNKIFMKRRLRMPVLAMGGEFFTAPFLANHIKLVAANVTTSTIKGSGHWIVQENTPQVQKDLIDFFSTK